MQTGIAEATRTATEAPPRFDRLAAPLRAKLGPDLAAAIEVRLDEAERGAYRRFVGLELSSGRGRASTLRVLSRLFLDLRAGPGVVCVARLARLAGVSRPTAYRALRFVAEPAVGAPKLLRVGPYPGDDPATKPARGGRPGLWAIRRDLFEDSPQRMQQDTACAANAPHAASVTFERAASVTFENTPTKPKASVTETASGLEPSVTFERAASVTFENTPTKPKASVTETASGLEPSVTFASVNPHPIETTTEERKPLDAPRLLGTVGAAAPGVPSPPRRTAENIDARIRDIYAAAVARGRCPCCGAPIALGPRPNLDERKRLPDSFTRYVLPALPKGEKIPRDAGHVPGWPATHSPHRCAVRALIEQAKARPVEKLEEVPSC